MTRPVIILASPQLGENIGAAARVMANFGLNQLRIVAPRDGWPNPKAEAMAAGALDGVVSVTVFDTAPEAVADVRHLYAATARPRDVEKPVLSATSCARLLHEHQAQGAKAAVMFGGESSGLSNEEVDLADAILTLPVDAAFSSLNLAQAVGVTVYSWRLAAPNAGEAPEGFAEPVSPPAAKRDFDGLIEHFETELEAARFFFPPDKQPLMVRNLRAALARAQLTEQEVRTLRGMLKSLVNGPKRRTD